MATTSADRTGTSSRRTRSSAAREGTAELADAQELLWASDRYALLVVLQAMDAAGKDSAIEHVMSGVNPQGVHVVSFKTPSSEELDHDFLWRTSKALPERGRIGIFNRSHYEEVVALRVHPEWLEAQRLPPGAARRVASGRSATRTSTRSSATSTGTGRRSSSSSCTSRRRRRRSDSWRGWTRPARSGSSTPPTSRSGRGGTTTWRAFEAALTATSTPWAPWYVVPADSKSVTQALVAQVLVESIGSLDLSWPERQRGRARGERGGPQEARRRAGVTVEAPSTDEPQRLGASASPIEGAPERLAGFIYGTLVALAMIVAGVKVYPGSPGRIAVFVVLTSFVLWLAHVYAHTVGLSVSHRSRLELAELRHIARREGSIVEAALPPIVPLLLGAVGLLSTDTAVWTAIGIGLVVLALEGAAFARIQRLGPLRTVVAVAANVGVGLLLVAAKLVLSH